MAGMNLTRKPEISLGLGLATATLVYAIYSRQPNQADIRVGKPGDEHMEAIRKQNAWLAAGTVAGISLLSKDVTVFIVGGMMVIALDFITRANVYTDPISNAITSAGSFVSGDEGTSSAPSTDYGNLQAVN